jgi:hypothetical protein
LFPRRSSQSGALALASIPRSRFISFGCRLVSLWVILRDEQGAEG